MAQQALNVFLGEELVGELEQDASGATCFQYAPVWSDLPHASGIPVLPTATTGNAAQTALDLGTSAQMLMQHYRELVAKEDAEKWFDIFPNSN